MNQKDMRNMLAQTLDVVAKILPTTNQAFCLAQGSFLAVSSQNPGLSILTESHFQRLLKTTQESTAQVLSALELYSKQLNDDSLWDE